MNTYKNNIKIYDVELQKINNQLNRISIFRLLFFIASITILVILYNQQLFTMFYIFIVLTIIGFHHLLKYHTKTTILKKHTTLLKKINEEEILREKCELEKFDDGKRFIEPEHPYTSDLDIFGPHSIYQLINRTTTESGNILLAHWLSNSTSIDEIQERQKAIKELAPKIKWRQNLQASGMQFDNKKSDYAKLLSWVQAPITLLNSKYLYRAIAMIMPILSISCIYLFYANLAVGNASLYLLLLFVTLTINYFILKKIRPLAEDIVENSTKNLKTLRGYSALIKTIEKGSFESEKLKKLQSTLVDYKYSAHKELYKLSEILDFSQQKNIKNQPFGGNYFYGLINSFLLMDIHLILNTEKWKLKNRNSLKTWADVVSEFEVMNSFAGFCYANPTFTFPEITTQKNYVSFEALGHPLIRIDKRVCNNFASEKPGNVVMITGSNMGGKSTFLRTIGLNIVLGLVGAPCCAKNGKISNLEIFSSMRTQDNLKEGVSSFYAELNRIEKMLTRIENNTNIFFLLDEMFKGTNSEDRHRGGYSLIYQISKLQTSGVIATHDIELAKLTGDKKLVTNYSFNSKIKDKTMLFDYLLTPGICYDFNASELMKRSGIDILNTL